MPKWHVTFDGTAIPDEVSPYPWTETIANGGSSSVIADADAQDGQALEIVGSQTNTYRIAYQHGATVDINNPWVKGITQARANGGYQIEWRIRTTTSSTSSNQQVNIADGVWEYWVEWREDRIRVLTTFIEEATFSYAVTMSAYHTIKMIYTTATNKINLYLDGALITPDGLTPDSVGTSDKHIYFGDWDNTGGNGGTTVWDYIRYSTFETSPASFGIELRDTGVSGSTNGLLVRKLDNIILLADWDYNRVGGCGNCTLIMKEKYDSALAKKLREDYMISIYIPDPDNSALSILAYQGYIDKVTPVLSNTEQIRIFCLGFINVLKRVVLQDYLNVTGRIDTVVKNIIEDEVVPLQNITSSAEDYDVIGYSVSGLNFNNSAFEIIQTLADIAGNIEWGVRADRSFFFKKKVNTVFYNYFIGEQVLEFKPEIDYNPMITAIYFDGGTVNGEKFTAKSFLKGATNHKHVILSNGAINTIEDAQRWMRFKLKDLGSPKRSYSVKLLVREPFENVNHPLGSMLIDTKLEEPITYAGAVLYDGNSYYSGGRPTYTIERIHYSITDDNLLADISLNGIKADIVNQLKQFEYELSQRRSE